MCCTRISSFGIELRLIVSTERNSRDAGRRGSADRLRDRRCESKIKIKINEREKNAGKEIGRREEGSRKIAMAESSGGGGRAGQ